MKINFGIHVRWIGLGAVVLVAGLTVALVAIRVGGHTPPTSLRAAALASPSMTPPPGTSPSPTPGASPSPTSGAISPSPTPGAISPSPTPGANGSSTQSAHPWAAAAFYPPSGKIVFFGGVSAFPSSGAPVASSETWTWDGASWAQLHPTNSPPPRYNAGLAYDPGHQVLVLFGGQGDGQGFLNDTWTWDGSNWRQMSPAQNPPAWLTAPMTYDATHKFVALYLGVGAWPMTPPRQTWSWDGSTWTQISAATDPMDGVQGDGAIGYDSATGQTIFVGSNGTFQLIVGSGSSDWRRLSTGGPTAGYDLVDDPATGVLLEIDGHGGTWSWDGAKWTALNPPAAPPARAGAALTYDPIHKQVVLFGGASHFLVGAGGVGLTDLWVWDGLTWKQVA